jgi:hypothetical protein
MRVVFFCFALSNLLGSSAISGVVPLTTSERGSRSRDADASGIDSLLLGSSNVVLFPVPHATRERSTATRHSRPWRRSCASDWIGVVGSTALGLLRAVVLREGARVVLCDFVGGGGALTADSTFFWLGTLDCELLLSFVMTLTRLSRASKSTFQ